MEVAPPNVPLSFEVTYDSPILDVAMSVYDNTGESPELVQGPDAMGLVVGNTYQGKFTGEDGKSYIILKAVYTDGTFDTLSPDYAQGSESVVCVDQGGGGGGSGEACELVGIVENNGVLIGVMENPGDLLGVVEC